MEFNENLKKIRKDLGKTQKEVAIGANINERVYQRYESGERLPTFEYCIALANYFDVTLDYLMCRKDTQH